MLTFTKKTYIFFLLLVFSFAYGIENPNELNIAVLGLGGRAQYLLCECIKLKKETGKTAQAEP